MWSGRAQRWIVTALASTAMVMGLWGPGSARAEQFGDATLAASNGGMVATASFSLPEGGSYHATFVIPEGVSVQSPHESNVDFTRPWVSFYKKTTAGPPPVGSTNPCSVVTNPHAWGEGRPIELPDGYAHAPRNPVNGLFFEAGFGDDCEDSFDSYRVRWDDRIKQSTGEPWPTFDTSAWGPTWDWWGSSAQQTSGHRGALVYRPVVSEVSDISICGSRAGETECLEAELQGGHLYWTSQISVLAG